MNEPAFEVLRAAVRIAGDEQVRRLSTLKIKLLDVFPGREEDIETAIQF